MEAGKISTSTAPFPPAAVGKEAMPTKSPGLMSLIEAAATPVTFHPGARVNELTGPSRVLTVSVEPSRLTIVPRTRTFSVAWAGPMSAMPSNATTARALRDAEAMLRIIASLLQNGLGRSDRDQRTATSGFEREHSQIGVYSAPQTRRYDVIDRAAAPRALPGRKLGDKVVHDLAHGVAEVEIERVDRGHDADVAGRREGDAGENPLQAAGLLQNQRTVALRRHDDPGEPHRVHAARFVHAEHGIESVAPEIGGVIDEPLGGPLVREAVEMPCEPAQEIARA